jgi:hypothetical protein
LTLQPASNAPHEVKQGWRHEPITVTQVLYNTAIRQRRREQIDQLLYAPEDIQPECLERLHRYVWVFGAHGQDSISAGRVLNPIV